MMLTTFLIKRTDTTHPLIRTWNMLTTIIKGMMRLLLKRKEIDWLETLGAKASTSSDICPDTIELPIHLLTFFIVVINLLSHVQQREVS